MNKIYALFSSICLILLLGCNGLSEDNGDSVTSDSDAIATSLALSTLNDDGVQQLSFSEDNVISIQATLLDDEGLAITGVRVDFSSDLGELSVPSSLTDSLGIAETQITNVENVLSAGTITASVETLSESVDFEYIDSNTQETINQLSVQLLLNGNETNQFRTDETVQVQVQLLDSDNSPIANEIVNYTTSLGEFETGNQSGLTSATGLATLTLLPSINAETVVGAGIIRAAMESDSTISANMNFQIISAEAVTEQLQIGSIDGDNNFTPGVVNFSVDNDEISSGGTTSVSVNLVDASGETITTPTQVSFTSNCVLNEKANIDATVLSNNGVAQTTFEDINCAGINGTDDLVTATVELADGPILATSTLSILGEALGSIEFVSAEPENIFLKGSGGQESSTLTFLVKGALGNPLAQQPVKFDVNAEQDGLGITLNREEGFTNSQGLITTQVSSGYTPAVIRVTAIASSEDESLSIQTESNSLTANTGLPHQSGFTIAATVLNPEASFRGSESEISAWLSDSFNNPAPDGTVINFTTEGGNIEPSCITDKGYCSVIWTAVEPYPLNHRSTILATATGHETFYDTNGDNVFGSDDGDALAADYADDDDPLHKVYSGLNRQLPLTSGFLDLPEAWRDDDENGLKDPNETTFFDQDGNSAYSVADGKFNGPQCDEPSLCASISTSILRKSLVLTMSSSDVDFVLLAGTDITNTCQVYDVATVYQDHFFSSASAAEQANYLALPTSIADNSVENFIFKISDSQGQPLPLNSKVTISSSAGVLSGDISYTQGNTNVAGCSALAFSLENEDGGDPKEANLTVTVDTPNTATITYLTRTILLL